MNVTRHLFGTAACAAMVWGVAGGCGRKEAPRVEEPLQLVDISQPEDPAPSKRLTAEAPKKVMSLQPSTRPMPAPVKPAGEGDKHLLTSSARPMPAPVRPAPVPDNEARELVNLIRPEAERGDAESQYLLGIFYVNGSGVPADRVESLKWLLLASAQDHKEASSARDLVTKLLSAQQRAEAEKRAKEFAPAQSPAPAKP